MKKIRFSPLSPLFLCMTLAACSADKPKNNNTPSPTPTQNAQPAADNSKALQQQLNQAQEDLKKAQDALTAGQSGAGTAAADAQAKIKKITD